MFPAYSLHPSDELSGAALATKGSMNANYHPTSLPQVLISAPVIASFLMFTGLSLIFSRVLGVVGPTSADQYSVLGTVAALAIVIVHVRKTDPSVGGMVSVFAGTLIGGVAGPGALISWAQFKGKIDPHTYEFITFHWWVLMGFFLGLSGWMVAQGFYLGLLRHIPNFFNWLFSKLPNKS